VVLEVTSDPDAAVDEQQQGGPAGYVLRFSEMVFSEMMTPDTSTAVFLGLQPPSVRRDLGLVKGPDRVCNVGCSIFTSFEARHSKQFGPNFYNASL
jgi:hypothetical protein